MLEPIEEAEELLPADTWPRMDNGMVHGNKDIPGDSEEELTLFSHSCLSFRNQRSSDGGYAKGVFTLSF